MTSHVTYKSAGVDITAGNEAVRRIKCAVESTFSPQVLTGIGSFGAMFDLKPLMENYRHPVLVQSIDGVGTKMMVAKMMQKFDTIGADLVSATANDIIVLGAKPLTLLDYIANDKLKPEVIEQIIQGMARACRENNISLVGGETAEMPGTYLPGEHDLVGVITGVVEKDEAILGKEIGVGDVVMAFPSSGLHTNGYSLARKLLLEKAGYSLGERLPRLKCTVGQELLKPHRSYLKPLERLVEAGILKGAAHITGGGLPGNLPRILPQGSGGLEARIEVESWPELPVFSLLREIGNIADEEMLRTFNMGIGMALVVSPKDLDKAEAILKNSRERFYRIGRIARKNRGNRF